MLGVLPTAEDFVIRAAYKALAQRYHPDRVVGDRPTANARMAEINQAYEVLSDTACRRAYDTARGSRLNLATTTSQTIQVMFRHHLTRSRAIGAPR